MKKNWQLLSKQERSTAQRVFPDLEEIAENILLSRKIDSLDKLRKFFSPDYEKDLHDPFLMLDMEKAVKRLIRALEKKETVMIYGDYDADGVTASAVLKEFFDMTGVAASCYIPDRNKEGYGLNRKSLEAIKKEGATLVITVDCGVSNEAEVAYGNELGLDIIILDHHHVPKIIPEAYAVVNPKREGDSYPEKELAGVGVAFKFVQAVSRKLKDFDENRIKWLLDLVSIGTIADCVSLLGENRVLAKYGLLVLSKTKRMGLKQLFQVGRICINESNLPSSQQVSFQIAPRINAAGRMRHADDAYQLLTMPPEEEARARVLALELESQNQHRQKVTKLIVQEVERRIAENKNQDKIIIEADPHWELGVIGLAAGKIADKFNRPVLLLQVVDDVCRGSGRSIKGFNLVEALERHKKLLEKYGGHRQAAGLTLKKENFQQFKEAFRKEGESFLEEDLVSTIEIDAEIPINVINDKLVLQLKLFEPFGQDNREPVFLSRKVRISEKRWVGNGNKHLKLWLEKQDGTIEAIYFGIGAVAETFPVGKLVDIVYQIEEDHWNGRRKIQMRVIDLAPIDEG